jgi:hypothetical protein
MKTLRNILLLVLVVFTGNSCFDDKALYELNDDGPTMVGFRDGISSYGAIADGQEYPFVLPIRVFGPGLSNVKSTVTATISVDTEASTAIEGTHFRIDNKTITLDPANNLLNNFQVTMLTQGIEAPLPEAPVMVLKVETTNSTDGVIASGKTIAVTLNYACFSNLAGTYSLVVTRTNYDGAVTVYPAVQDVIVSTGKVGEYHTSWVGHYFPGGAGPLGAPATEGFIFTDVCSQLSVPQQDLGNYYSNQVSGTDFGTVDKETGVITLYYQITFAAGIRTYVSVYTPVE